METTIPAGHASRAPTADDAGAVGELLRGASAMDKPGRDSGLTLLLFLLDAFRCRHVRFAEAAVHGRTAAAARLFESVGMTAARMTERWEKVLGA